MSPIGRLSFALTLLLVAALPAPGRESYGVVIVVDGAGDRYATRGLEQALQDSRLPIQVASEGTTLEGVSQHHARAAAERLVQRVKAHRQSHPTGRLVLIGFSAGTPVVLLAAEQLPPGSVDRIILLGASVSTDYDLRTALRTSREGIDSFYSERDHLLGVGTQIVGTSDRKHVRPARPAGLVGFSRGPASAAAPALYQRLWQYRWNEQYLTYDHHGGHFGWTRPAFMRAFVLPLIMGMR